MLARQVIKTVHAGHLFRLVESEYAGSRHTSSATRAVNATSADPPRSTSRWSPNRPDQSRLQRYFGKEVLVMRKGNTQLIAIAVGVAVLVAGLMVVFSQLDAGSGSQETFAGIPQDGTTLGRKDAPVTVRLYEDFQCPACAQFVRDTLPEVVERYVEPGNAKLVSETMTFLGPDSVTTARAAFAAGEQDLYWQYAFLLFENQGAENSGYATDEFLAGIAEETEGLDVDEWEEARRDDFEGELQAVQKRVDEAGVEATPTLVVSGPGGQTLLRGAVPIEEVEKAIRKVEGS